MKTKKTLTLRGLLAIDALAIIAAVAFMAWPDDSHSLAEWLALFAASKVVCLAAMAGVCRLVKRYDISNVTY